MVSKKEKLRFYGDILNKGLCKSMVNEREKDYIELMELFKNHPEYPFKLRDVVDIQVVKNKRNSKYFEFNLIRKDGSIEDISYRSCICQRTDNHNLLNAMRNCIQPQINHFKENSEKKCVFCGNTKEIHIDHIYMFKDLTTDFLKDKMNIPSTFDDNFDNSAIFKEEDEIFSNSWYEYHLKNANLRPLCKKCNLSREKKYNSS